MLNIKNKHDIAIAQTINGVEHLLAIYSESGILFSLFIYIPMSLNKLLSF